MNFTAEQIASYVGGTIEGKKDVIIKTFAKIEEGTPGAISFLANLKYEHYLYDTESSVVLVNNDFVPSHEVKATLIRVENAYETIAKLLTLYESLQQRETGISDLAFIDQSAELGDGCYVAPFAVIGKNVKIGCNTSIFAHTVIGDNVTIGDECIIYPNVTVYKDCKIGNRCIFHAGCVIGSDGFGFAPTVDGYEKIPQIGIVTIEDDVELGANTCVDRSTMGSTYIRKGVKLDNLVQIAHNVEVGKNTVMSSQTGVAGSAKIGEWCMFGGQVGIAGHIKVGDNTHIGAQSGVPGGNLARKGGATMMGYPAVDHKTFARQSAALKSLPEALLELENVKKQLIKIQKKLEASNLG